MSLLLPLWLWLGGFSVVKLCTLWVSFSGDLKKSVWFLLFPFCIWVRFGFIVYQLAMNVMMIYDFEVHIISIIICRFKTMYI